MEIIIKDFGNLDKMSLIELLQVLDKLGLENKRTDNNISHIKSIIINSFK